MAQTLFEQVHSYHADPKYVSYTTGLSVIVGMLENNELPPRSVTFTNGLNLSRARRDSVDKVDELVKLTHEIGDFIVNKFQSDEARTFRDYLIRGSNARFI